MAKNSTFVATLKFVDSFSSGFSKTMRNFNKETKSFQRQMKALNDLGSSISDTGRKLTVGLTLPIVALGTKAVTSAISYEKSLNKIMTLSRKFASNGEIDLNNPDSINAFRDNAKNMITDLSNTYGRAQTEIAESYYTLASAFNDTSKMQEALNTSLQMGIAGEVEAGSAAKALATIYNAYGGSITEIGDKIAATVNFGFTTYSELAETLGTVVPTAAQAKVSFDDLATSMAVITSTGVSTAEATTYLKNAMNQIIKNGDMGKIQDGHFLEYLQQLEETMPEIDDQMKVFTNIRARSGITALVGNTSLYAEYSKQIKNASGTLQEMNDTMMKSNSNQFAVATTKLSNILQRIGEQVLPTVNKYLEKFSEWLDKADLSEENINRWIRWGVIIAGLGPALTILGNTMKLFASGNVALKTISSLAGSGAVQASLAGMGKTGAGAVLSKGASTALTGVAGATSGGLAGLAGLAVPVAIAGYAGYGAVKGGMEWATDSDATAKSQAARLSDTSLDPKESARIKAQLKSRGYDSNGDKIQNNNTITIPKLADTINASDSKDVDSFMDKLSNVLVGVFNNR